MFDFLKKKPIETEAAKNPCFHSFEVPEGAEPRTIDKKTVEWRLSFVENPVPTVVIKETKTVIDVVCAICGKEYAVEYKEQPSSGGGGGSCVPSNLLIVNGVEGKNA